MIDRKNTILKYRRENNYCLKKMSIPVFCKQCEISKNSYYDYVNYKCSENIACQIEKFIRKVKNNGKPIF